MTTKTDIKRPLFGMTRGRRRKLGFYLLFIAFPLLHYLVFYVYINFNSFILAFKDYYVDDVTKTLTYKNAGFANFVEGWKVLGQNIKVIGNSLLMLAVQIFAITPVALLFSFYIYKKRPGTEFFRVMLFLPSVLSAVVFGLLYQYISDDVLGLVQTKIFGAKEPTYFLTGTKTRVFAVILFNVLIGFGVSVLTYSGTMSGINVSLIESAELDGCSPIQEFLHIVIPMIWPTVVTLMIVSFSRVFTEQWQVLTLLKRNPLNAENLGYFLYTRALDGDFVIPRDQTNNLSYSVLSAIGLILTAIVLPLTLLMRWALNKYGPKAD